MGLRRCARRNRLCQEPGMWLSAMAATLCEEKASCVGQPFPTARRQEWTNGLVWSHLSWLVGRGFAW